MNNDYIKKYEPIAGEWYVKELIGKGSYGKVYRIEKSDISGSYEAALKIISIPQSDEEQEKVREMLGTEGNVSEYYQNLAQNIVREFKLMSQLKGNSNIVSYEDHTIYPHENGTGYDILIRMELLTPLTKVISTIDGVAVVKMATDICKALELCKKRNIVHRDIKPENIFVSRDGDYKLGDFGVAKNISANMTYMTTTGTGMYMAPELKKGEKCGLNVDIYSLGMVLYKLFNYNRDPFLPPPPATFTYADREQSFINRMNGVPLPAPAAASPALANVILRACEFNPAARYQDPEELRRALEAIPFPDRAMRPYNAVPNAQGATMDETVAVRGMDAGPAPQVGRFGQQGAQQTPPPHTQAAPGQGAVPPMAGAYQQGQAYQQQGGMYTPPRKQPGNGNNKKFILFGVIGAVVLALIIGIAVAMGGGSADDNSEDHDNEQNEVIEDTTADTGDNILEYCDLTAELVDSKYTYRSFDYRIVAALGFDFYNGSDEDRCMYSEYEKEYTFTATQNAETLESSYEVTDGAESAYEYIVPGGTERMAVSYILNNSVDPVVITVTDSEGKVLDELTYVPELDFLHDETLEAGDHTAEYYGYEIVNDEDGNEVVVVYLNFTNGGNMKQSYNDVFYTNARQQDSTLDSSYVYMNPDSYESYRSTLSANVDPGDTKLVAMTYELRSLDFPVIISVTPSGSSAKGSFDELVVELDAAHKVQSSVETAAAEGDASDPSATGNAW